jgi:hypothetical protein
VPHTINRSEGPKPTSAQRSPSLPRLDLRALVAVLRGVVGGRLWSAAIFDAGSSLCRTGTAEPWGHRDEELAALFDAFDLEARYNHLEKALKLSVAVFPELAGLLERERPPQAAGRSKSFIARAGFEPATSGL